MIAPTLREQRIGDQQMDTPNFNGMVRSNNSYNRDWYDPKYFHVSGAADGAGRAISLTFEPQVYPWELFSFWVSDKNGYALVSRGFVHVEAQDVKEVAAVTEEDAILITGGPYVWICIFMVWATRVCSVELQVGANFNEDDIPQSDGTIMRWPLKCYQFDVDRGFYSFFHHHWMGDIHLATAL